MAVDVSGWQWMTVDGIGWVDSIGWINGCIGWQWVEVMALDGWCGIWMGGLHWMGGWQWMALDSSGWH